MPTLPLYTPLALGVNPFASRQVIAPGGTEWWHVDAFVPSIEMLLIVDIILGDPFCADHAKAVRQFLRRPTKQPPPHPHAFSTIFVALYRRDELIKCLDGPVDPDSVSVSASTFEVHAGGIHLSGDEDALLMTVDHPDAQPFHFYLQLPDTRPSIERTAEQCPDGRFLHWVSTDDTSPALTPPKREPPVPAIEGIARLDYLFTDALLHTHPCKVRRRRVLLSSWVRGELNIDGLCEWASGADRYSLDTDEEAIALAGVNVMGHSVKRTVVARERGYDLINTYNR